MGGPRPGGEPPILAPGQADRPLCIRYGNEYAAMIAAGVWKPKKHKAMAERARQAWKRLKSHKGGQVWIRHADRRQPRDGQPRAVATRLAAEGKRGVNRYAEDVQ